MGTTLCVAGKNQAAVDVLVAGRQFVEKIVCLPNSDDDGVDGWQPSLAKAARAFGVETVTLNWAMAQPDLLFMSVEYDRIIKPALFASSRLYNVHFSLLPKYRGCNTAVWPILNGEAEHGVTLHEIDAGIDSGPIVAQRSFPIDGMTSRQSYGCCLDLGAKLALEWLPRIISGDYTSTPQDEAKATHYPRDALDYGLREIDLSEPAEAVMRRIRAFTFPEYQRPTLGGRQILGAESKNDGVVKGGEPARTITVETADGAMRLHVERASRSS